MGLIHNFAESLPAQCPPADAEDGALSIVYRLVANENPTAADFASKAANGLPCPPGKNACDWASCSLFGKPQSLLKYQKLRAELPYLAKLTIPEGKGKFRIGSTKRGHIDFWRYSGICLSSFVVEVK